MKRESPLSEYRVVRELSYAWSYYLLSLQFELLGKPNQIYDIKIQKSLWSDVMGVLRRRYFGELLVRRTYLPRTLLVTPDPTKDYSYLTKKTNRLEFPEGVINREDLEEVDREIFDFLAQNWNRVYLKERNKASILGYIAEYLIGEGEDASDLKEMTIPEFSEVATTHNLPGLEDIEVLEEELGLTKEQTYGLLYAQARGAEWLAVYDENGERKGKAHELITKMYREQIAAAIANNAGLEEIQSLMISPDDTKIQEALGLFEEGISAEERGEREKEYEELVIRHLNRDMRRFAYTEVSINFNNGKLLYLANEKQTPTYVRFGGGNY
ncbi:hypothetical protein [Leptospira alstonii]|uniref:Uncharacterized protein n=1 Tax=Leptospira alstonii serovar Sichuan str. 79601 TaxID=1218565 RepID=M6CY96_9LEPT|nr:hypothetical protein [Leptospira alstonii]AGS80515.1 hypothetical protein LEP1GSC193_0723 [Leptospira phage vB_LalZ_80412-LE1]EMJ95451.1 hypothetical protein LEP1GSC194_3523 [Leptospira alstonii serovar Sichuan str. 79601]